MNTDIHTIISSIRLLVRTCKAFLTVYERQLLRNALLQIALNLDLNDLPPVASASIDQNAASA